MNRTGAARAENGPLGVEMINQLEFILELSPQIVHLSLNIRESILVQCAVSRAQLTLAFEPRFVGVFVGGNETDSVIDPRIDKTRGAEQVRGGIA